jgi:hypothetical protein
MMELVPAIAALLAWRERLNPRRRLAVWAGGRGGLATEPGAEYRSGP